MPTEERLALTMVKPDAPAAMSTAAANKITSARIRYALANMSHELYPEVLGWIREVAKQSPSRATELYLELVQFSIPKLKAVAIAVTDENPNPKRMSLAELQSIVSDQ